MEKIEIWERRTPLPFLIRYVTKPIPVFEASPKLWRAQDVLAQTLEAQFFQPRHITDPYLKDKLKYLHPLPSKQIDGP